MSGIPAGAGQLLGKRLGKFEIVALLALGGTAEIYLARIGGAAGFEKYVVVKCLHDHLADDSEFVKMFLDEARLAAHLDHSNIVQTMELGQYDGRYYMVMEFLAGLSLAMIIRRVAERLPSTRMPVPLVLNILAQSCAGLHYAHEKAMNGRALNIVHRDISPQNLVISFEGVVKLVDFGIAKAEMRETRTRSGTIKGKFAYMSPEQCVANNVDRRTDVFALGVIGHELLTGRRLFKRPSPYETYQAVMECDVKPPSTVEGGGDPALDQVIMGALTKDKVERYPTAEAFGDALLGYLHHRGIGSRPADVARFFDAYFTLEIDEHSARMRELISGRDVSVDTGVSWGGDDPDDDAKRGRAEDSARRFAVNVSGGLGDSFGDELSRDSSGSMGVVDDLGAGSRVEDDDEMPAEPTRIESNPLERVNELERLAAAAPKAKPSGSGRIRTAAAPQLTPPPSLTPSGIPGMPPSGRFPDLANLPTMIAEGDHPIDVPPAEAAFGNAPTGLAPPILPAGGSIFAKTPSTGPGGAPAPPFINAPTKVAPGNAPPDASAFANVPTTLTAEAASGLAQASMQLPDHIPPVSRFANAQTTVAPPPGFGNPAPENARTQIGPPGIYPPRGEPNGGAPGAGAPRPSSPSSPPHASLHAPPHASPHGPLPGGYPVLNAELSAQIATGATVFPSDQRGPVAAPRIEPSPRDGFPARVPSSGPRDMPFDPQRAANVVSPVGQHYPENVDWDAAAAAPVRAVPRWLLALLFVGALGIALALTIAIARLLS